MLDPVVKGVGRARLRLHSLMEKMPAILPLAPEESHAAPTWLAAYTRPRREGVVSAFCERLGLPVFVPRYRSWRNWSDRRKLLHLPLFPSYVFVRVTAAQRLAVLQVPGVLWFVHNGHGPAPVDESELDIVRRALACGQEVYPLSSAQLGDEIEIVAGSLRGCRGYLIRQDGQGVALRISAIEGAIRVWVPDVSWVRRRRPRTLAAVAG
jgi:transcription antitermination factor NusG